jgi:hypothetical protein
MILVGVKMNSDVRNDDNLTSFVVLFHKLEWKCVRDTFQLSDEYTIDSETEMDIFQFWFPDTISGISESLDYKTAVTILESNLWDVMNGYDTSKICITIEAYRTDKYNETEPDNYSLQNNLVYKSDCRAFDFINVDGFETLPEIFDMVQRM